MMVHVVRSIVADGPGGSVATAGDPPGPVQAQVEDILAELRLALGELRCVGSERLAKQGVSMTHLHVLSMLDHHGDVTMSHLADLLGVSLSNLTGLVDRMEERAYVERERDRSDRRVVLVRLTEGGRRQLEDIQLVREGLMQKVLSRLDAKQLTCVRDALASLRVAALAVATDPDVASDWHTHRQWGRDVTTEEKEAQAR
jgi:DNA-binding MarR family transcriptional regulator